MKLEPSITNPNYGPKLYDKSNKLLPLSQNAKKYDDVKNSRNGVMKAFYEVTVDFPTSSELELPEFWQNILKLPIHT